MYFRILSTIFILAVLGGCFKKDNSTIPGDKKEGDQTSTSDQEPSDSLKNESDNNISDDTGASPAIAFSPNDPLYNLQWYIKNNGESPLGHGEWSEDADINVENIFSQYDGTGQSIIISDSGTNLNHPDLNNTALTLSKNYTTSTTNDPSPSQDDDTHGTFVMGIVGATTNNNLGIVGIAPGSELVGYKFIGAPNTSTNFFDQMEATKPSIFNYSYGHPNCDVTTSAYFTNPNDYEMILKHNTLIINNTYITASGNDQFGDLENCEGNSGEYFIGNSNYNQDKIYSEIIVVGATNSLGRPTRYSTPGSNILISAPGGENHGFMIGLDLPGCIKGNSTSASTSIIPFIHQLENGSYLYNEDCDYTYSGMQGTSFSSPIISGVVSLIRQACSNCLFRDIKYLLVQGANQIENFSIHEHFLNEVYTTTENGLIGHDWDTGNIENNYGLVFNNFTGFGIVDVKETISLAEVYTDQVGFFRHTVSENLEPIYKNTLVHNIPDNDATGVEVLINVDKHNFTIEHARLEIRLNHQHPDEVGVELTSPSGTTSILSYTNTDVVGSLIDEEIVLYGSNAFYGESSIGQWKVKFIDGEINDAGTVDYIALALSGGTWGNNQENPTTQPINNLTINLTPTPQVSFQHNDTSNILRFEYCITLQEEACQEHHWTYLNKDQTSISPSGYINKTWQVFETGKNYTFRIKAINEQELDSPTAEISWNML
jgi:subtilisin-like proprotein convertase family protein